MLLIQVHVKVCPNTESHLLVLLVVIFTVAELVVVHQMSERLRGDGHHIGEDEAAVAAGRQHQLVVAVVVADAPYPATNKNKTK